LLINWFWNGVNFTSANIKHFIHITKNIIPKNINGEKWRKTINFVANT